MNVTSGLLIRLKDFVCGTGVLRSCYDLRVPKDTLCACPWTPQPTHHHVAYIPEMFAWYIDGAFYDGGPDGPDLSEPLDVTRTDTDCR